MSERTIRSHVPCPRCNSSDGLTVYDDHDWCYSCGTGEQYGEKGHPKAEAPPEARSLSPMTEIVFDTTQPYRGLELSLIHI